MVTVELKQHIGHTGTPLGVVEEKFDQWMMFASINGRPRILVGFLGFHANAHIQPVVDLPESVWLDIKEAAEKEKARLQGGSGAISEVTPLPSVRDVQAIEGEEDDGEE